MTLSIQVIAYQGRPLEQPVTVSTQHEEITIGRKDRNALVLQDPYVSGVHVTIVYHDPQYFLHIIGVNGVTLNHAEEVSKQGGTIALNDQDRLLIGEHELLVSIAQKVPQASESDALSETCPDQPQVTGVTLAVRDDGKIHDPTPPNIGNATAVTFAEWPSDLLDKFTAPPIDAGDVESPIPLARDKPNSNTSGMPSTDDNPQAQYAPEPFPDPFPDETAVNLKNPQQAANHPPRPVISERRSAPAPFNKAHDKMPSQRPPTPSKSRPPTPNPVDIDPHLDSFLRGTGLEPSQLFHALDEESCYQIGRMFRTAVEGARHVLMARAKSKSDLHLEITTLAATDNNPIKFSLTVEEAMTRLLTPIGKGMPPEEAIKEAFRDIATHQSAVLAGMETAFTTLLKRFDPDALEQRQQKTTPVSAAIPLIKQVKLWQQFALLYEEIAQETQEDFHRLFDREFAKAYQAQIKKMR